MSRDDLDREYERGTRRATKPLAVIRMLTFDPLIITTEDYEQVQRDVRGRVLAGDAGVGDQILLRLLEEHAARYSEAKALNSERRRLDK